MVENDVYDNGTFDEHRFCPPIQSKTYEKNIQDLNYRSFVSELSNMWLESQSDCWFYMQFAPLFRHVPRPSD